MNGDELRVLCRKVLVEDGWSPAQRRRARSALDTLVVLDTLYAQLNTGHFTGAEHHLKEASKCAETALHMPVDWLTDAGRAALNNELATAYHRFGAGIQTPPVGAAGQALATVLQGARRRQQSSAFRYRESGAHIVNGLSELVQAHAAFEAGDPTAAEIHLCRAAYTCNTSKTGGRRPPPEMEDDYRALHAGVYALGATTATAPIPLPARLVIAPRQDVP